MYRGCVRTFRNWWDKVHKCPAGHEFLVQEYWLARDGKDPTNQAFPYSDWSTPQMRAANQLIPGTLPFDPFSEREVDAMRNDWERNGYLRQDKNLLFEVSVVAMQQVIAYYREMPEFAGWTYISTGTELDEEKKQRNDWYGDKSGNHWKENQMYYIGDFVARQIFGCNAMDFKQGYLRYNAHLVTQDPAMTSRRDRAIIDQTAKTLAPRSQASRGWLIDTGASHTVIGSSPSSSNTEPTRVVIDQTDRKRKILLQSDSWFESKRIASERIAMQRGEGSACSSSTVVQHEKDEGERSIAKDPKDMSVEASDKTSTAKPSSVRDAK